MAHLYPQLGLQPLRLTPGALWNRWLGGHELLNPLLQLISRLASEGKEGRACKLQLSLGFPAKVGNRLALIVIVGAKQDQLALDRVFSFEPEPGWTATVGSRGA